MDAVHGAKIVFEGTAALVQELKSVITAEDHRRVRYQGSFLAQQVEAHEIPCNEESDVLMYHLGVSKGWKDHFKQMLKGSTFRRSLI